MSCGKDKLVAQRRALARKQALSDEAEQIARRRAHVAEVVDGELESQRAAFERHRHAQLIALQALQARALSMLGDGQKHAASEEYQERSKAKEGAAVWKDVAEATIARQRLALAAREREAIKSPRSIAAHQAAFRRQVIAAASRESRMIAREKADAEKEGIRSASKESSLKRGTRGRRAEGEGGGDDEDDASTYYSDDEAAENGGEDADDEELAYHPGTSKGRRGSVSSASDPYRRQLARARATLASKAPRSSPFFGPRAVDRVSVRRSEDVAVTSCLARVGDAGPTMVQSAVRAPTVVVRQRRSSIRRKRSQSREGSVVGAGGGDESPSSPSPAAPTFIDARLHATLAAAALEEERRKEGLRQQERERKAAERGRAAGAAMREEREAQAALETLARLDAWATAAAAKGASPIPAIESTAGGSGYAYLPSAQALSSPSTGLRSLRASLPITAPPPVRPAFLREAKVVTAGGSGMRFAHEQPAIVERRVFRDDVLSGASSMDRRADGRSLNAAAGAGGASPVTPGAYVGRAGLKRPLVLASPPSPSSAAGPAAKAVGPPSASRRRTTTPAVVGSLSQGEDNGRHPYGLPASMHGAGPSSYSYASWDGRFAEQPFIGSGGNGGGGHEQAEQAELEREFEMLFAGGSSSAM